MPDPEAVRESGDCVTAAPWSVHMLRCRGGTYYVGIATDVADRLAEHNQGKGPDYTRRRRPVELVWSELHPSKSSARRRELQLKGWTRAKKEALMRGFPSTASG